VRIRTERHRPAMLGLERTIVGLADKAPPALDADGMAAIRLRNVVVPHDIRQVEHRREIARAPAASDDPGSCGSRW
jgi:hypothetical protein